MSPANTYTKQRWIAEQARRHPERVFTTLHRHLDRGWMHEAYRRTRKDGAAGIDGATAKDYERDLEANLTDLLSRIKSGSYVAPPVRRHWIPKADGTKRPLGIPTFEDKVAQRAVVMLLEPVLEADFLPCSHGFRPGRSAQGALDAVWEGIVRERMHWVVDLDVSKYFDSIPHGPLRSILDLRIKDGVVRRMLDKWLKAGVLDEGTLQRPGSGTPQGGVVSPLLANLYLHHVLDGWFEREVRPRMRGKCRLVRYADDAVMLFEFDSDGRRVLAVLEKRLARWGLKLHPEKTRYLDFRPRLGPQRGPRAGFDFLGFTHYWVRSRKGWPVVRQTTARNRLARALKAVSDWCRRNRHLPLTVQQAYLASVIRGHCQYYGRRGNSVRLASFRYQLVHIWRKWLSRRSRKSRLNWDRMRKLLERYPLPAARVRFAGAAPLFARI